jgi:hypothetical protein
MTESQRLARIAAAHQQAAFAGGVTSGACAECELSWPCATYVWASEDRDPLATWDPADTAPEDQNS